ncbi:DUF1579 domain-containing protein [bacterium]|jgi:hypothetical protein|nr:DUF1579 domain-containing protein [bacterium]MBT4291985.1 DUF1579 domain-containing protein [bacterium]MBT7311421.1 DUF1579 domain-containing protein [bacterium]
MSALKNFSLVLLTLILAMPLLAQDMMSDMSLGPEHNKQLERAGTWDVHSKMWMAPGMEPMEAAGVSVCEAVMGGRYTIDRYTSDFMGMTYEGLGLNGYDTTTKRYWSTWSDNMNTDIGIMWGTVDESGKVYTYHGDIHDEKVKSVATKNDDGTVLFEMFMVGEDGTENKTMEMFYTRRK